MKEKRFLLAVVLCVCALCAFGINAWADAPYAEQPATVYIDGEEAGALTLRFYEAAPHVPYLGIGAYARFFRGQSLTLRENGDGTCTLVNEIGAELLCDAGAGTIFVRDWNRFFDLPLPLEDEAKGWKDSKTHFARITAVEYEGEAAPVTLDLAKYDIKLCADADDVYLPVSTLSNIMTDIATNHLLYNGESLYAQRFGLDAAEGYFASERMQAELAGQDRPDDVIRQCYADLCFNFDTFFGHPGRSRLDEAIAEKGLDQALTELGAMGTFLREELLSPKLDEYLAAMVQLFTVYLFDGHTYFSDFQDVVTAFPAEENLALNVKLGARNDFSMKRNHIILEQLFHYTIPMQRARIWGGENYLEYGSTAIIRFDDFMPDEAAWDSYYKGEGPLPEDSLGVLISGLRRASENPAIENVILDESCNGGGSSDVMMLALAMTTGRDRIYGINRLTGQRMIVTFEADANLDGVFDERDRETRYDFNYGLLVSRSSFSMGNYFPFVMQEEGAVLIGEAGSGGSCCVQIGTDAEGFSYMMSSAQWKLTDSQWSDIEGGCRVDLPIDPIPSEMADMLISLLGLGVDEGLPSFENYYDEAMLDGMLNDWFAAEMENAA